MLIPIRIFNLDINTTFNLIISGVDRKGNKFSITPYRRRLLMGG